MKQAGIGAFLFVLSCLAVNAQERALKLPSGPVGKNLQTYATVELTAPFAGNLELTLTSSDPSRLVLAKHPATAGAGSITLTVRAGFRESPEFWLQGLADSGDVEVKASAPAYTEGSGIVTLSPSGIAVLGPSEAAEIFTTPRGYSSKLVLRPVRLDASLQYVEMQSIRGGLKVPIQVTSSDSNVGEIVGGEVNLDGVTDLALVDFKPKGPGTSTLSAVAPGFSKPATRGQVVAHVKTAGLGVQDEQIIGENLQVVGVLSLGEAAPEGGLVVTLKSSQPDKLLLSNSPTEVGKDSIKVEIAAGATGGTYVLQALAKSGTITHTASAPGYSPRTGTVYLAPSGVVIMMEHNGPPDEAEYLRPNSAGEVEHVFTATVGHGSSPVVAFTAFLDPDTGRAADITVQPLRAGLSLPLRIGNSNPEIGSFNPEVTIAGGLEYARIPFTPLRAGETRLSVATPNGFTKPTNATELLGLVRE